MDLLAGIDLIQGVVEGVLPPDPNVLVFRWEDCPGFHVPTLKGDIINKNLSEPPQDCADYVAESDITTMRKKVHDRHDSLPDGDGESMEE